MKEVTAGNKLKATQLGMPIGTAMNRLRKQLLFRYIVRCGENICYRCGGKIVNVAELSVDHCQPWLHSDNPAVTFFDLGNIAFSHLSCNAKAGRKPNKISVPSGQLYCYACKICKSFSEFPQGAIAVTTYRPKCRKCDSAYRQAKKLKSKLGV